MPTTPPDSNLPEQPATPPAPASETVAIYPSVKPDTSLTYKLHAKADLVLEAELRKLFNEVYHALPARTEITSYVGDSPKKIRVDCDILVQQLRDAAFENLCHSRRNRAVEDFLAKVDALSQQVDDLRNV